MIIVHNELLEVFCPGPDLGLVRPQATVIVGPQPPHAPNYIKKLGLNT